jgi:hypothetical protein
MTRLRLILGLSLLALLAGCTESSRIAHLVAPEASITQLPPTDVAQYTRKYPDYDGVMINVEQTIEHSGIKEDASSGLGILGSFVKSWTFSRVYKERYIVLNPEARWLTTYSLNYKPDTLYMLTISPSGKVTWFGKDDLKKYRDDDGWDRYKIAFPRVEKGTIIEIGYEDSYTAQYFFPPIDHDIVLQYPIPCEHLKFTYAYPNWWTVANKQIAPGFEVPITASDSTEVKKRLLVYEKADIPALRPEPFSPPFKQMAMYYQFMVTDLEMKGTKWHSQKTWADLAKQFRKYVIKKVEKRSDEVQHLTDSVTAGVTDNTDKLDRIVTWVSRNIERSGRSNHADPLKTLTEKKGTVYDMTGLAQAMLYAAGIGSSFLLVHDAEDGYFDPNYISEDQIHAPALRVEVSQAGLIVFPWIKDLPLGLTPGQYQGQTAIVVSEEGGGGDLNLPIVATSRDMILDSLTITLDSSGATHVVERRTFDGMPAYRMRRELERLEVQARDDSVKALVAHKNTDLTALSYSLTNDTLWEVPLTINFTYDLQNLIAVAPEEAIFQTVGLFSPIPEVEDFDTLTRQNPIWIETPTEYRKQVVLKYPESWTPTTPVDSVWFENEFGIVISQNQVGHGLLTISQKASLKKTHETKAKITDLADLVGTGSKASIPVIVFKTGFPPPHGKP